MDSQSTSRYSLRKRRYIKSLESDSVSEGYSEDNGYDTSSSSNDSKDGVRPSRVKKVTQKNESKEEPSSDSFDPTTSHSSSDLESEEINEDGNSVPDPSNTKETSSRSASDSSRTLSTTSRYPIRRNRRVFV